MIAGLLLIIERQLAFKINKELSHSLDLTLSQWKVTAFLDKPRTSTLVGISNYLSVEKPSVTRTVASLDARQLVIQVFGKDKREKRIQLTDSGREIFAACLNTLHEMQYKLLEGISNEEHSILLQLLTKMQLKFKKGRRK